MCVINSKMPLVIKCRAGTPNIVYTLLGKSDLSSKPLRCMHDELCSSDL